MANTRRKLMAVLLALTSWGWQPMAAAAHGGSVPTAQPVAPARPDLPTYKAEDCAVAETRARILKVLETDEPPGAAYLKSLHAYSDALMSWKLDRLAKAAKWSPQRRSQFAMTVLEDPRFVATFEATLKPVQEMMATVEAVIGKNLDPGEQCLYVLKLQDQLAAVSAGAQSQWAVMNTVIDAEAKRLGLVPE